MGFRWSVKVVNRKAAVIEVDALAIDERIDIGREHYPGRQSGWWITRLPVLRCGDAQLGRRPSSAT
jgi:hypothetical protein